MLTGIKQAELAHACGISPSYLNLIEHNRRRIGGKLLQDIATALGANAQTLAQGAETELIEGLHAAAAAVSEAEPELDRSEEFAGRFHGWAELVTAQARRIAALERMVENLNDRISHDPFLSASLHDIVSTVTAIQATSSILADGGTVDPDWQARFHRNLNEDSMRLAEASQSLVSYLDPGSAETAGIISPQEEVEAWFEGRGYHVTELEEGPAPDFATILDASETPLSLSSRQLALKALARYRADALSMPLSSTLDCIGTAGLDPAMIAARFRTDLAAVMRRLSTLPADALPAQLGLVICDGSGTLTFRKPIPGFPLPRFSSACPVWPLYRALANPTMPIREHVIMPGSGRDRFLAFACCGAVGDLDFQVGPVYEATMLLVPADIAVGVEATPLEIGTSCRICPRDACLARREPSILSGLDDAEVR